MIEVLIERQALEGQNAHAHHQVPALLPFLVEQFGEWPEHARLYHGTVAEASDVTPESPEDIPAIAAMPGPFTVVIYPGDPATATMLGELFVKLVAAYIISNILAPEIPTAAQRTVRKESPNNGLSDRSNSVRVNGRIPDIYGMVRSTPDLIAVPYKIFVEHVELELSYMCVGRGQYEIPAAQVRDDTTPCEEIAGTSVEIYGPNTSPNSGHEPQLRIGNAINTPVLKTSRVGAVNGQTLQPANSGGFYVRPVKFLSPNIIESQDPEVDFTANFLPGDPITLERAAQTSGIYTYSTVIQIVEDADGTFMTLGDITAEWEAGQRLTISASSILVNDHSGDTAMSFYIGIDGIYDIESVVYTPETEFGDPGYTTIVLHDPFSVSGGWNAFITADAGSVGLARLSRQSGDVLFDLSGVYTINTLTSSEMTLNSPASVNPGWTVLADDFGGESQVLNPDMFTSGERWVGEFTLRSNEPIKFLINNFVALNGLFVDDGKNQYRRDVAVRLEATPIDADDEPTGDAEVFDGVIIGASTTRASRALTLQSELSAVSNAWKVRARRLSLKKTDFNGTVVDEVKWRDLYAANPVAALHFGNVTTAQTLTYATDGALNVKDRKLNMLVTSMLPRRVSDGTFTTEKFATKNLADILSAVCLDSRIGNRTADEVDFDNLYEIAAEIVEYFGIAAAAEFNYTFDNDNMSFEETVQSIASAVFCTAYRRGSVIRVGFERQVDNSVILFNHRNKRPGSEKRDDQFGARENFDGIEFQYVDPYDDSVATIYIPEDRSAVNPKKIESIGIRNYVQASLQAWRAYNKLLYQNMVVTAECLPEADLLITNDRILMTDNVRTGSMDGDIQSVAGLEVELSQAIPWQAGETYTMFLQNTDAQVESMPVTKGSSNRHAVLLRAPRTPVVTGGEVYAATTFTIVRDGDERNAMPFLVSEKESSDDDTYITVTAVNYDERYYQNDGDFRA